LFPEVSLVGLHLEHKHTTAINHNLRLSSQQSGKTHKKEPILLALIFAFLTCTQFEVGKSWVVTDMDAIIYLQASQDHLYIYPYSDAILFLL
jgi:hypothetical protein